MKKNKKENPFIYIFGIAIILSISLFLHLTSNKKEKDVEVSLIPKIDCATNVQGVTDKLIDEFYDEDYYIKYTDNESSFVNLLNKSVDIVIVEELSDVQLNLAKEKGIELDITEVFKDGFAFIINKNNSVTNFSSETIKNIYSGKIANWNAANNNIAVLALQENNISESKNKLIDIMGEVKLKNPLQQELKSSNNDIIESVRKDSVNKQSIGYAYLHNLNNLNGINILSIDGVSPSYNNIQNDTYIYSTTYYIVTRKNDDNEKISKFKNNILSLKGQGIIKDFGYVLTKNNIDNN